MVFRLHISPRAPETDMYATGLNVALLQSIAEYLRIKGWNATWNAGESTIDAPVIVVDTGDMDTLFSQIRALPFIQDVEFEGFDAHLILRVSASVASGIEQILPHSTGAPVTNLRFPSPMPPEPIVQAVAYARAGFTVVGFTVLEEAMTVMVRGVPTRTLLVKLVEQYERLQEQLAGTMIEEDTYTEIPTDSSITVPDGIPLQALEAALECVIASFAVYGFARIGNSFEPISANAIDIDALQRIIDSMS